MRAGKEKGMRAPHRNSGKLLASLATSATPIVMRNGTGMKKIPNSFRRAKAETVGWTVRSEIARAYSEALRAGKIRHRLRQNKDGFYLAIAEADAPQAKALIDNVDRIGNPERLDLHQRNEIRRLLRTFNPMNFFLEFQVPVGPMKSRAPVRKSRGSGLTLLLGLAAATIVIVFVTWLLV
jgi:hypothetical protein